MQQALTIARRELRDVFTDWRVITPMVILALIFPCISALGIRYGLRLLEPGQDMTALSIKFAAFGALVVGFFPSSFSLIMALESFVGEKERNTLEALLATSLSDHQLYFGKLIAVLVPPLFLSYTALIIFMVAVQSLYGFSIPPLVTALIMLLTPAEAVTMVCAGVVVSSTTSTLRAANLLASFIILPMSMVVQLESLLVLQEQYHGLWFILAGLVMMSVLTVRWGLSVFNREEILARESTGRAVALGMIFRRYMRRTPDMAMTYIPDQELPPLTLRRLYTTDIPQLIKRKRVTLLLMTGFLLATALLAYTGTRQLPFEIRETREEWVESILRPAYTSPFPLRVGQHVGNDIMLVLILLASSMLTLGIFGVLWIGIQGFVLGHRAALVSMNPLLYLLLTLVPSGLLRLGAYLLIVVFLLPASVAILHPPKGVSAWEYAAIRLVDVAKIMLVAIPLLLLAALADAGLRPEIVRLLFMH